MSQNGGSKLSELKLMGNFFSDILGSVFGPGSAAFGESFGQGIIFLMMFIISLGLLVGGILAPNTTLILVGAGLLLLVLPIIGRNFLKR